MKFTFENLGYIDKGEITPGNLTIIAGNNNIGKTYINYAIFGFLSSVLLNPIIKIDDSTLSDLKTYGKTRIDLQNFINNFPLILKEISENYKNVINDIFSVDKEVFKDMKFNFELNQFDYDLTERIESTIKISKQDTITFFKEENSFDLDILLKAETHQNIPDFFLSDLISKNIFNFLIGKHIKKPFIITSERTGVSLFYKELDVNKNILVEKISKQNKLDIPALLFENLSRYPNSIKFNIDLVRDIYELFKKDSFILEQSKVLHKNLLNKIKDILQGSFVIKEDQILFEPLKERKKDKIKAIPLHVTSSATKSLLLLFVYMKAIAQPNDILMIDEPELNLHPSNQMHIARLIANLVNLGIDVMITTHSDYMIKEFNNLIMLSNDFVEKERIMKENKYEEIDILHPDKVKAYFIEKHKILPAPIDNMGIELKLFDDTIYKINQVSNDIYYSIMG